MNKTTNYNLPTISNEGGLSAYLSQIKKFKNIDEELEKSILQLDRQFLHAKMLGFIHPKSGKELEFSSILPHELENILKTLRNTSK